MSEDRLPLIVIVGPTASGKTSLAIKLAKQFGGEIICADSRTVYKGMDIGTAKPTAEEQAVVPHWGLDLVDPGEKFSVAQFQEYANQKIDEIRSKGRIPFLVGGTGLYVDSVLFQFSLGPPADARQRSFLGDMSIVQLKEYCIKHNIKLPENQNNKRYLVRVIECNGQTASGSHKIRSDAIVVGIATEKHKLQTRIHDRTEQLFMNNVVEEAISLGEKYGWDSEAMTGNIYSIARIVAEGSMGIDEAKLLSEQKDRDLAKRQMTWFRRNPHILWACPADAEQYLSARLGTHDHL